jgi:hypothetical protein
MRWQEVSRQYLDLFAEVREERNRSPKPVEQISRKLLTSPNDLTEIKLDHLLTLTDDVGVLHHAKNTIPDRHHGYTTEDNAKALVTVLMAQDHLDGVVGAKVERLLTKYLSFLEHAFDPETARFRDKMRYDRRWSTGKMSEDVHAQAILALGEAVARCQARGQMTLAADLFHRALPACEVFENPQAWAHALIGIHAYLRRFSGDSQARRVRETLADKLFACFCENTRMDWNWPIDQLGYANARLPHALLISGRWLFRNDMIEAALHSLEWLNHIQTGDDGRFAPVGDDTRMPRGGDKPRFNQKPLEASVTTEACLEAFHVTNDPKWTERAERCMNWFLGENDLHTPVYDHLSGGCHDALMPQGVNENQGAEATLAWLTSLLSLYNHAALATDEPAPSTPIPGQTQPDRSPPKKRPAKDNPEPAAT